jgi:hypothetical protein
MPLRLGQEVQALLRNNLTPASVNQKSRGNHQTLTRDGARPIEQPSRANGYRRDPRKTITRRSASRFFEVSKRL